MNALLPVTIIILASAQVTPRARESLRRKILYPLQQLGCLISIVPASWTELPEAPLGIVVLWDSTYFPLTDLDATNILHCRNNDTLYCAPPVLALRPRGPYPLPADEQRKCEQLPVLAFARQVVMADYLHSLREGTAYIGQQKEIATTFAKQVEDKVQVVTKECEYRSYFFPLSEKAGSIIRRLAMEDSKRKAASGVANA